MILVNLLPENIRPKKRTPLPYIVCAGVFLLAMAAMGYLWMQARAEVYAKQAELLQNQHALEALKDTVAESNELTAQKKAFQDKVQVIQEIAGDRVIWSKLLWDINRLTPENFWYKKIEESIKTIQIKQQVIDPKTNKPVINPQTNEPETKTVPKPQRVLTLEGYVIEGPNGDNSFDPLLLATRADPEFSKLFKLLKANGDDTAQFEKTRVNSFSIEYLFLDKEKDEAVSKDKAPAKEGGKTG